MVKVPMECAESCIAEPKCVSYNLNTDGLCSLMEELLDDGELSDDDNYQFSGNVVLVSVIQLPALSMNGQWAYEL